MVGPVQDLDDGSGKPHAFECVLGANVAQSEILGRLAQILLDNFRGLISALTLICRPRNLTPTPFAARRRVFVQDQLSSS
jgi:hypothetical protein